MIIGIDLGTTNSLCAVWKDGKPQLVPNPLGEHLTPSVVGMDESGEILVGAAARERLITHPDLTAAIFKRYMGSERKITLGKKSFRPEELSAMVLRSLKADAEAWLGESVSEAVITVPAYFNDAQRTATKIAGQLAGLKVERLVNEPTAAALAYGLHNADGESCFLVFDLGGGTFDVSILEMFDGVMEVRASAGDNFLGGEDFVDILIDAFMRDVGTAAGFPEKHVNAAFNQQLRHQTERLKRQLTQQNTATLTVNWDGKSAPWTVTDEQFARLAEPLLIRLRTPIERALRDATIRASELDQIVLAGGATRMPIIRKLVARMFGRLPASNLNPDEVVAMGAAVQAGLKMRDAALNEVVMTDVCPYTLGVEVSEMVGRDQTKSGFYLPIIERNSVVPISRSKNLQTLYDNQRNVELSIYQGESRLVRDNIFLGKINVSVPPRPAGEVKLDVRFTYDINGILEAEVTIPLTNDKHRLVIEENPGVMSQEQIELRFAELAQLKIHPRSQAENRAVTARAERIYEQSLGDIRSVVGQAIKEFLDIVEGQNVRDIHEARLRLIALLDKIDSADWL